MPTFAIAVDVRETATNAVVGVALLVPDQRYATYLADYHQPAIEPSPTPAEWRQIDAWHTQAEAGLPFRTAPDGSRHHRRRHGPNRAH